MNPAPTKWRVQGGAEATILQLSLRWAKGKGEWNSSQPVPLGEIAGLTAAQVGAPSSDVRFQWKRDTGTFSFEGHF